MNLVKNNLVIFYVNKATGNKLYKSKRPGTYSLFKIDAQLWNKIEADIQFTEWYNRDLWVRKVESYEGEDKKSD